MAGKKLTAHSNRADRITLVKETPAFGAVRWDHGTGSEEAFHERS